MFFIAQVTPSTGIPATNTAGTGTGAAGAEGAQAPVSPFATMLMPILLLAVFYIFLLRPQAKKEKERQKSLKALSKGDRVVTRGGMIGSIVGIRDDEGILVLKIGDDTKVEVLKNSIEQVNPNFKAGSAQKASETESAKEVKKESKSRAKKK